MLDAVAAVWVGMARQRLLHRGKRLLDGGVADGMDRELVALRMIVEGQRIHLVIGEEHEPFVSGSPDRASSSPRCARPRSHR